MVLDVGRHCQRLVLEHSVYIEISESVAKDVQLLDRDVCKQVGIIEVEALAFHEERERGVSLIFHVQEA